uniref:SHR-BD domain-containing protein n=1 Tax=Taenia asiatica TaxID=60517 RepID=A0A0R3VWY0_TAEAS
LRPAIKVNPLGHVILTSGALFSQTKVPPDPVHIQYYRFRIVDITIGLLERRNASEDGAETWSKVHEFTGHEVLSRKIRYVANVLQPENFQPSLKDTIILKVIHLTNTKEQVILVLPVNFVRIELALSRNEPLTILQMHQVSAVAVPRGNCITRWNLEVESVPPQPPHNMYYTVTKATKHGHIYLLKGNNDKVYLGLGSVFRQSDVNAGQLFYKFKRVINDRSEATLRIEKGLIYVKDKFHFRIHIHSYRPKKEHVFGIDILESSGEFKTPPSMLNLPLNFRKQVGFINKCGILTIKPPLLEMGKRDCLKIQTVQLKSPMFEYVVEILSQPQSGKVYIVQPDRKCAIDTTFLPATLSSFYQMAYNVNVSPEDVSIRVVRAPVSGCLLLDDHAVDEFDYSAILRYRITYWQCKSLHDRMFSIFNLTELRDATLLNSTLTVENFDVLTLGMIITPPEGITWGGRVDVKVRLTMNDLTALKNIKLHPSVTLPLIQVKANLLSVQLVNPSPRKFIEVRISRSPIQLRDILPLEAMEEADAVYRVLSVVLRLCQNDHCFVIYYKVPCRGKLITLISQFRVENVLIFSASDLRDGRVQFIPSTKCKNETDGDLNLLEQITDSRGSTHEQLLTIRISISPGRYAISFRNLTIGIGERVVLKKSNLHIIEMDDEGRKSPILGCSIFSNETVPEITKDWLFYDEVFVIEEPPTCGSVFSKRFVLKINIINLSCICLLFISFCCKKPS